METWSHDSNQAFVTQQINIVRLLTLVLENNTFLILSWGPRINGTNNITSIVFYIIYVFTYKLSIICEELYKDIYI